MSIPLTIIGEICRYLNLNDLLKVQLSSRSYFGVAREILLRKFKKVTFKLLSTASDLISVRFEKDNQSTPLQEFGGRQFIVQVPISKVLGGWKLRIIGGALAPLNVKECLLYELPLTNKSSTPRRESSFRIVQSPDMVLANGRLTLIYFGYTSLSEEEFWISEDEEKIPWENYFGEWKHEGEIIPSFRAQRRFQKFEEMIGCWIPVPHGKNVLFRVRFRNEQTPMEESYVYFIEIPK